jgi:hypothetical protein
MGGRLCFFSVTKLREGTAAGGAGVGVAVTVLRSCLVKFSDSEKALPQVVQV